MTDKKAIQQGDENSVHSHDLEPPGLGGSDEPYFLPDIDDEDEKHELPFCKTAEGINADA